MEKRLIVTGKSIDEAIKAGLSELGVPEERVTINIIEQPAKGLFGLIGSKEAKVELVYTEDPIEGTIQFLKDVLSAMGLKADVKAEDGGEEGTLLNIIGTDLGMVIGRRGQTLDALQYLTNIVVNRMADEHIRVVLDAESFRERRRRTLQQTCDRMVQRVLKTKKEVVMEPMSAQERKVVHYHLQDHPAVKTYSKGEDPNRCVVIALR
ncbi:RNA-binding cell elongation regulator Jag/EloR [Paenibacillus turpanensis]|uniref:RNA-binding cell elongation regulator Jag/EloR n=1 Tax=Paenibacillus turpanensis TaxID=2689078 RepID=UPI00140D030D